MKDWPGGSYIVMKITLRIPGVIPLMAIGYKYNSRMVLRSIANEGDGSTEPGDTYLSHILDSYYNVYVCRVVCTFSIGMNFNACNAI